METYCSIWVFLFCKHPMRAVLYKKISQSQSIRTLAYLFYTIGLWDAHQGTGNQDLQQTIGTTAETAAPLILVEMAKAVSERNEVECSFDSGKRIYRANNIRAKRPETARCWTGMCYFVKNVMKFLRELCLCIRQSLRFLCSIWRITHSYEFYSNCA